MLEEGNDRFRHGRSTAYSYPPEQIDRLGSGQKPKAAVIACVDGRVTPEIIFDQPLTNLFVSRVPGNVASDSAKWMLELAVTDMRVPLVVIMGHTNCLAVGQVVRGESGAGGSLRMDVAYAVANSKRKPSDDPVKAAIIENALHTKEKLMRDSAATRQALQEGRLELVCALYDVHTGKVEWLDVNVRASAVR